MILIVTHREAVEYEREIYMIFFQIKLKICCYVVRSFPWAILHSRKIINVYSIYETPRDIFFYIISLYPGHINQV